MGPPGTSSSDSPVISGQVDSVPPLKQVVSRCRASTEQSQILLHIPHTSGITACSQHCNHPAICVSPPPARSPARCGGRAAPKDQNTLDPRIFRYFYSLQDARTCCAVSASNPQFSQAPILRTFDPFLTPACAVCVLPQGGWRSPFPFQHRMRRTEPSSHNQIILYNHIPMRSISSLSFSRNFSE